MGNELDDWIDFYNRSGICVVTVSVISYSSFCNFYEKNATTIKYEGLSVEHGPYCLCQVCREKRRLENRDCKHRKIEQQAFWLKICSECMRVIYK